MVTEIEYTKALNQKGWSIVKRKILPVTVFSTLAFIYVKHCEMHERERAKTFYNKSKLYGTAKNPQY